MIVDDIIRLISEPSISAIVGAIAGSLGGGLAVFIANILLVRKRKNEFNEKIAIYIRLELSNIQELVNDCIESSSIEEKTYHLEQSTELFEKIHKILIFKEIENYKYYVFAIQNYTQLTAETKAQVFNEKALESLEYIYRKLESFHVVIGTTITSGFYFNKDDTDKLLEGLNQALTSIPKKHNIFHYTTQDNP